LISNVIAALSWVATNYQTYNIRVVNLSVGAPIRESYWTDPLTLACKRVEELGITVVTAAGNRGEDANGQLMYGGITAPGNAPWVLTVGASSTQGTLTRADDVMADYSSAGPTAIDFAAKPDLVAPGTGTVSLLSAGSQFAVTKLTSLIAGTVSRRCCSTPPSPIRATTPCGKEPASSTPTAPSSWRSSTRITAPARGCRCRAPGAARSSGATT
jgi:hypothetical protein